MPSSGFDLIIAGPCSAESEKLCIDVAGDLVASGHVDLFRAGVWKPRSLSGMYEGPGEEGLKYLLAVRDRFKLPLITEVATANHVEAVLKNEIDAVWIGARTVTDPFSVEELASVLGKSNIRVFVKNPLVPDIKLWIGAVERLLNKNVNVEAVIHRGFVTYSAGKYRNEPLWFLMAEIRNRFPDIKIIADPSHIAGNSKYISEIAAQAKEMEADGLMIEVHSNPSKALSDALQQITPKDFAALIQSLSKTEVSYLKNTSLELLRKDIDDIDLKLLQLFAQRFEIVNKMGVLKRDSGMTIMQGQRWSNLVENRLKQALELGINVDFVKELLKVVHDESIRIQLSVNDEKKKE